MKQFKKYMVALAVLIALLYMPVTTYGAGSYEQFQGERSVTYAVDLSMLSNYFNGGRAALDLLIRGAKPEWLRVDYLTEEKNLYFTLSFPFGSQEDYSKKIQQLSGRAVLMAYTDRSKITYTEDILSIELLNFLKTVVSSEDNLDVYQLYELFSFKEGTFLLNGETYAAADRLCIPDGRIDVKASDIKIETVVDSVFQYERSIQITVPKENMNNAKQEEFFKQIKTTGGTAEVSVEGTEVLFSVTFHAVDDREVAYKTMLALGVSDLLSQQEHYINDQEISCDYFEQIDLSQMLDGTYRYSLEFPQICRSFQSVTDDISCEEGAVTSDIAKSPVKFSYIRPFSFSKICIYTDLSALSGKLERKVCYYVPSGIANDYHELVKQTLAKTLVRGQELRIYDEVLYRKYEVGYGSWFQRQLTQMTQSQYDAGTNILKRPWFLFQSGQIRDSVGKFKNNLSEYTGDITYSFAYPAGIHVKQAEGNSSGVYTVPAGQDSPRIVIHYTDYSLRILLLSGFLLLLPACFLLSVVLKVRKTVFKHQNSHRFCPQCGGEITPGIKFCGACGHKL